MQIIVLANELQKKELSGEGPVENVVWIQSEQEFLYYKNADAFIDLGFAYDEKRKNLLEELLPKLIIVNSVTDTLFEINPAFIRINGWNSFLSSSIEASGNNETIKLEAEEAFSHFNKKIEWLPDEPGFISARVVSMIINEAFICLAEGVSTKEEIDTAMKLGTAYPYGPFEWGEKIGLQNIFTLLNKLSGKYPRYQPAELMVKEINSSSSLADLNH